MNTKHKKELLSKLDNKESKEILENIQAVVSELKATSILNFRKRKELKNTLTDLKKSLRIKIKELYV